MSWLNALLAFALAMIVFCTVVSAVTEFIQHLWQSRQDGLKWMLERFYTDVVTRLGADAQHRQDFLDKLTTNLGAPAGKNVRLAALSYYEFAGRFAQTEAGQALWTNITTQAAGAEEQIKQRADALIAQLAPQFARFEADGKAYFAQRARSISIGVAVGIAFILNVDAVRLFSTFMADQQLTQQFLVQAKPFTEAAAAAGGAPAADPDAAPPAALDAGLSGVKQRFDETSALGLPIGARYFPWCAEPNSPDIACRTTGSALGLQYVRWFVVTLLTGLLIGLGGPFWFDVYSKLSVSMQAVRGGGASAGQRDQTPGAPGSATDPVAAAAQAFRDAAR